MGNPKSSSWSIFKVFVKRKLMQIFSKDLDLNLNQEPLKDWEQKVQERELKRQAAKKAWEERQKQLELKSAQEIQANQESKEINETPQENIE
ncbi:hypothetical protein [Prochlorococcus marinus]|uniref:hypothetical protein n=1 Tax=Prochlorococcus marinus TaxID=1219 RepID=UPI0022B4D3D5|nr:hypothetical protein [Prochlorococcus marinus]